MRGRCRLLLQPTRFMDDFKSVIQKIIALLKRVLLSFTTCYVTNLAVILWFSKATAVPKKESHGECWVVR